MQSSEYACGPTCLAMVLRYFGRHTDSEALRAEIMPNATQISALSLRDAALRYGLSVQGLCVTADQIHLVSSPAILHWREQHFVLLEHVTDRYVQIVDPAFGRRVVTRAHFAEAFSGTALSFEPGRAFHRRSPNRNLSAILLGIRSASGALLSATWLAVTDVALVLLGASLIQVGREGSAVPRVWSIGLPILLLARVLLYAMNSRCLSSVSREHGQDGAGVHLPMDAANRQYASYVSPAVYVTLVATCDPVIGLIMAAFGLLQGLGEYLRSEAMQIRANAIRAACARYSSHVSSFRGMIPDVDSPAWRKVGLLRERWVVSHRHVRRRDRLVTVLVPPLGWVAPIPFLMIALAVQPGNPLEQAISQTVLVSLMMRRLRAAIAGRLSGHASLQLDSALPDL
jgi:hypothetical protein